MTRYEKKMDHRDTETQRKNPSLRPSANSSACSALRSFFTAEDAEGRGGNAEELILSKSLCLCVSVVHLSLVQFMGEGAALENGRS